MDIALLIVGFLLMIVGLLGSFLPVLPGPPISWAGLLLLYLTKAVADNWWLIGITFGIAVLITILDYVIPAYGSKKFGGSKYGAWGATLGLIVGVFLPIPFGFLVGAFLGAFIGEFMYQNNTHQSLNAALGSFLGVMVSNFMKFMISLAYLIIFVFVTIKNFGNFF